MSEKKPRAKSSEISRREFLKEAGLVVGGAAIGSTALLAACSGTTTTQTATVTQNQTLTQTQTQTQTLTQTATTTATTTVTSPPKTTTVTATATAAPTETAVTILNPEGQMEPIPLTPLTPRVKDGLAGKTIYVVSVNFSGTEPFLQELTKLFQEKYPTANIIYKIKEGSYAAADQNLWAEVAEKADAYVMGVGH